tara:strand:+ start:333 stop:1166 length:834 start_codon:yes stop_codon:yes gene_type:complete
MAVETDGYPIAGSSLENIDVGFYEFIDEVLNLHVTTNKGFEKVPILWNAAERAFQIKNNVTLRDSSGKLRLPIMSIERSSVTKDPSFKGSYQANNLLPSTGPRGYKNNSYLVGRRIVGVKSSEFMENDLNEETDGVNNNGYTKIKKIVYEEIYVPIPVYIAIIYSLTIRTEYQQQMNQLIVPLITSTGQINSFVFEKNGYRYEAFIQQDFVQDNNSSNLGEEERFFSTKIDIKVLGHINGLGDNDNKPQIVTKENVVEVKLVGERVVKSIDKDKIYV